jgi:putative ABC transport system ATP-binding protein
MISIQNLEKSYRAGETTVRALRGVDLEVAEGEFTALAGPSGSGKTTLLNLIGCIDTADGGTLLVDGLDVSRRSPAQLSAFRREKLGFIFQNFNLVPVLTAFENVALALNLLAVPQREVEERTRALLALVGLAGMEDRLPTRLSGGQQQRVAIARALVKNPRVVLADEPTANLDSDTGRSILELMLELNRTCGVTFLFSTHDAQVMQFASRLVRLHDGRITGDQRQGA